MRLFIYGNGGFGKEILSWKNDFQNKYSSIKFIDDDVTKSDLTFDDLSIIKDEFNAVIAIGNNRERAKALSRISKIDKFVQSNLLIGKQIFAENICIGINNLIMHNTSIANNSIIECNNQIHGNVVIGHDVTIGNDNFIGSNSFIGGGAVIGNNVTIYPGSVIAPNVRIEDNASIGIGSVVIRKVKNGYTVFGNPAKKLL